MYIDKPNQDKKKAYLINIGIHIIYFIKVAVKKYRLACDFNKCPTAVEENGRKVLKFIFQICAKRLVW